MDPSATAGINYTRSAATRFNWDPLRRTIDNMVTALYRKLGFDDANRSRASLRDWARAHGLDRV